METLEKRCRDFVSSLENKLQIKINISHEILSHVLVHPSYAHEKSFLSGYERMEFLGDSIVNAVITSNLYQKFNDEAEGTLSRLRSVLISAETLGDLAREIHLDQYLYVTGNNLSFHQTKTHGRAFEAFMGALFLSFGFNQCETIFNKIILLWETNHQHLWFDKERLLSIDVKSRLQEKLHEAGLSNPHYIMVSHEKKIPQDEFVMALMVNDTELGRAKSTSKKDAEKLVAKNILDNWNSVEQIIKKVD